MQLKFEAVLAILATILTDYQTYQNGSIVSAPQQHADGRTIDVAVQRVGHDGFAIKITVGETQAIAAPIATSHAASA